LPESRATCLILTHAPASEASWATVAVIGGRTAGAGGQGRGAL